MKFDIPSPDQYPQLLQLWNTAFGEYDGFWQLFLNTGFDPENCRCLRENGQILSAHYWFECTVGEQKMAYLYGVVTHPDHRGKGLFRRLMEETVPVFLQRGYSAVLLVPEKEGLRTMYRKMGYRDITTVSEFSCPAGTEPVSLRAIGPGEYAALRRRYLPADSVLQEGRNLDFLAAQARFYAGKDFLLAAWQEEDTFHGMELLGNRDAAPGIVAAAGCARGEFRTPGEEKPFAMFLPLSPDAIVPAYFGLAFD